MKMSLKFYRCLCQSRSLFSKKIMDPLSFSVLLEVSLSIFLSQVDFVVMQFVKILR